MKTGLGIGGCRCARMQKGPIGYMLSLDSSSTTHIGQRLNGKSGYKRHFQHIDTSYKSKN